MMDELGPIGVAGVVIYVLTGLLKVAIDLAFGGTEKRKLNPWASQLLLPSVPLILGWLYGAFVPFRPDFITDFVATHGGASMLIIGGMYGIVIGQFSDYIYTKVNKGMRGFSDAKKRKSIVPPPPAGEDGAN